jgi:two-component system, cell cycle sensor histidine kinase and response regulator CckA
MSPAFRKVLQATLIYLAIGSLWILFSDRLLLALVQDAERLSRLQTAKGWFYVASTALIFFFVRLGLMRRLQRAQQQLETTQKMEALGRMAAGMAHDFRNVVTVMAGNAELASARLPLGHAALEPLAEIGAAGQKAEALISQLLAFSRGTAIEVRAVALGPLLQGLQPLLKKLLPPGVDLQVEDRSQGARVQADPNRLEQALLNMVANARDAFSAGLAGALVRIRLLRLGGRLRLIVSDNGCGIPPEAQAHIFEPFYTTKPEGQGTGLGLATVYATVQACGGEIRVDSTPGQGTAFRIDLPLSRV